MKIKQPFAVWFREKELSVVDARMVPTLTGSCVFARNLGRQGVELASLRGSTVYKGNRHKETQYEQQAGANLQAVTDTEQNACKRIGR